MGVPSHFIRVSGCNLRCVFKDSICDTPYSSFNPETPISDNLNDMVNEFKKLQAKTPGVNHVVVTGGEPLMYKKDLEEFLSLIYDKDMIITIETNGTKSMLNPLSKSFKVSLYSVSPKLSTSVAIKPGMYGKVEVTQEMIDRHNKQRIDIDKLVDIACNANDYQFKFVYSDKSCVDEITNIYKQMADKIQNLSDPEKTHYIIQHPNKHTMLMPEGITNEQLAGKRKEIVDVCLSRGWTYTDRLHILIWGDKRGV